MNNVGSETRKVRTGVDVGGTFTDLVLVDQNTGKIFLGKRLTTHADPSRAILGGLERIAKESGRSIESVDDLVHGTTLVTNTIIERRGAKVGLLTTRGFRDSLELGKEIRHDRHDLFLRRPEPLVCRRLRQEAGERINAAGEILLELEEASVRAAAQEFKASDVEAIAVCFLHSYANAVHEQRAKQILQSELPGVPITLSHEISPEIREYERANTACANAYVQPMMNRYLTRLDSRLREAGFAGSLSLMLSGGGLTRIEAAEAQPIHLIESGPAAGATAAAFYSRITQIPDLISFDMGGTTAKMCLIEAGQPERSNQFEAARVSRFQKGSGLPLKIPVIDLIEIGAGGGSIARIDQMGLLKVGPQSAGSEPGPVCYGRGGRRPTVTDADLVLGYLSPTYFLGGEMELDMDAVQRALHEHVAEPLNIDVLQAAIGIRRIVDENMAAATRMYIAEKGRDPRQYALLAFGGAGPVHAHSLAKLLGVKRVVVPLGAGVMSALGFLVAAPAINLARSYAGRVAELDWQRVNALLEAMEQEASRFLTRSGIASEAIGFRRCVDMRHLGQGFEIPVDVPDGILDARTADTLAGSFRNAYEMRFGRSIAGIAIEALTWRLAAVGPAPEVSLQFSVSDRAEAGPHKGSRMVYFPETGFVTADVLDRYRLGPGMRFEGPAVVEERESTTIIGPHCKAEVDASLNLIIELAEVPRQRSDAPGEPAPLTVKIKEVSRV
ncbi:hydantoinase/oxoprolinase family protein [Bradyrhizobium rifense]|uniref:Hydantoinase/oxoprolinase family protein n=1 Tax=Bradyrhizobium rifense TaxID=515499 RepID=A0A5D3K8V9_9BRAD|nr:hydantoinase/oxoprolinase family protein [Bradyrhizobium rifense]TYL92556.1 hydantoinase/oxoprolinase family protein [Bradyrhizobium rifense]